MTLANATLAAAPQLPQPFTATYAVTFRGISGGTLQMKWHREGTSDRYVFETTARPSFLASLVIDDSAFERATLENTAEGLRPVSWAADDGRSGEKGNGELEFNWVDNVVSGTYDGKPVKLTLEPGVEDRLSIQISVMTALMQGQEPGSIAIVNGDKISEYTYKRGNTETIDSKLGKLDAVIYESTRSGSSRISRVWHVPSLEYLPARAEQIRKGKVETVMTLVELKKE